MATYKTTKPSCPLCGFKLYWSCRGETGWAHCSRSIYAVRDWSDKATCPWKGKVVRKDDNSFYFIIEEK